MLQSFNQIGKDMHETQNLEIYSHFILKPEAKDIMGTSSSS